MPAPKAAAVKPHRRPEATLLSADMTVSNLLGVISIMHPVTNDTTLPGFFPATAMPDEDWWQALWPEPKQIIAALGIRPDMDVIDLCCGDGLFTAPLALAARHVTAVDIDRGMLAVAEAKIAAVGATNCDLVEGDAYAIADLVKRPVDFVLIANTFHGVPISCASRAVLPRF